MHELFDLGLPLLRELGALALVAIVLLYLIRDYLPTLTQRYLEQLQDARRQFLAHSEAQRQDFAKALESQQVAFERHLAQTTTMFDLHHQQLVEQMKRLGDKRQQEPDA